MKTLNFNQCKADIQDLIDLGWEFSENEKQNYDVVIKINEDGRTVFHLEHKSKNELSPFDEWSGDDTKTIEDLRFLNSLEKLWEKS